MFVFFEILIKFLMLVFWSLYVVMVWLVWAVVALIQLCARQRVWRFPPSIGRGTYWVLRWAF